MLIVLTCVVVLLHVQDEVCLRCTNANCRIRQTIRKRSFFENSRLSIRTQLKIMVCFCADLTVTATAKLLKIRRGTVTDFYDNMRGEYMDNLHDEPIQFSENGEYEVDECQIRHVILPKNRGYTRVWIGGILERETGKVLLYKLTDRSRLNLERQISQHIPAGSFVYSDEWPSYRHLGELGYVHYSVNHSKLEYVRTEQLGPLSLNVHINTLEGINREIRRRFSNKSSRTYSRIDLTLSEIMYRRSGNSLFYPFKY